MRECQGHSEPSRIFARRRTFLGVDIRYFVIQLVIVLYNFSRIFESVGNQYVYFKVSEKFNFTTKVRGKSRCYLNKTNPEYDLQQKVQNEATQWELYLSLAGGLPAMFMVIFLGTLSDRLGRRFIIIVTCSVGSLRALTYIIVTWLNLSLTYLLIGHIIEGLGGFRFLIFVAIYAYTSDYTENDKTRSFLMTVLQVTTDISLAVGSVTSGYAIRDIGFYLPNVICLVLLSATTFICIFLLKDSQKKTASYDSPIQFLTKSLKFYFHKDYKSRRKLYLLGISIYVFPSMIHFGHGNVQTYFLLNSPLCWDAVKIGTFTAIDAFLHPIGLIILVKILQRWFSDIGIAMLGAVSSTAAMLMLGFAYNDAMMLTMYCVGILSLTPMIFLKAILSKITEKENQGALFAGFGFIDASTYILGQFFYTMVYTATLQVKTGMVFLVMAGQLVITTGMIVVLWTMRGILTEASTKTSIN